MAEANIRTIPTVGRTILEACDEKDRDGCIYLLKLNPLRVHEQPVKLLSQKIPLKPGLPLWDQDLMNTVDLVNALDVEDRQKADELLHKELEGEPVEAEEKIRENPLRFAAAKFSSGLSGFQFVVWWRDKENKLDIGLYCPNRRVASYALLLARGVGPLPVGNCPECGRRFRRSESHSAKFCSTRCRVAFNVRKYRRREREKRARRSKR
jgi:hypothetical protein